MTYPSACFLTLTRFFLWSLIEWEMSCLHYVELVKEGRWRRMRSSRYLKSPTRSVLESSARRQTSAASQKCTRVLTLTCFQLCPEQGCCRVLSNQCRAADYSKVKFLFRSLDLHCVSVWVHPSDLSDEQPTTDPLSPPLEPLSIL